MKKFFLAIAASSLLATPVLAAPGQSQDNQPRQEQVNHSRSSHDQTSQKAKAPAKTTKGHQWKRGERFDRAKATSYRVIGSPRAYKLQPAPKGYRWVQSGRDALLVRLSNNIVISVVSGAIR